MVKIHAEPRAVVEASELNVRNAESAMANLHVV